MIFLFINHTYNLFIAQIANFKDNLQLTPMNPKMLISMFSLNSSQISSETRQCRVCMEADRWRRGVLY